ncbi:MAG: inositol monophosphatase family protein [Chloroflexota bacterium]
MYKQSDYLLWQAVAEKAAQEAGALMLRRLQEPLELTDKGFRDVVTAVDFEAQALITDSVQAAFPEHAFLTEEEDSSLPQQGEVRWIIDPIDGTSNYSRGIPSFCTSIGVAVNNEIVVGVIYDPNLNELFSAVKGEGSTLNGQPIHCSQVDELGAAVVCLDWSRENSDRQVVFNILSTLGLEVRTLRGTGSAALALAWIAAGRFDGYINLTISSWDWAAGALLIAEAGGLFTQAGGSPVSLEKSSGGIAATKAVHGTLEERVRRGMSSSD